MIHTFTDSISDIGPTADSAKAAWNRLNPSNNPFCRFEFLAALENTGCCSSATGWQPQHILIKNGSGELIAAVPSYLKKNSYGEYVFDWSWADAYHRSGHNYYPKLLSAIPFTPSIGPRVLVAEGQPDQPTVDFIVANTVGELEQEKVSGWHILFPQQATGDLIQHIDSPAQKLMRRQGTQFHWTNHDYRDFDEFLDRLTSRKRKNIRKERRKVESAGVACQWFTGAEISPDLIEQFYVFYQLTYYKRGQRPYLSLEFFQSLVAEMPDQILLLLANHQRKWVAGALFFRNHETLFGRYWGCTEEFDQLHFECCYYQGIDYAIQHQLTSFDAGAQGEHKILRGFEPIGTSSFHWIAHPIFREAIADFLEQERAGVQAYMRDATNYLPYKTDLLPKASVKHE